uniref:Uncharacterized protein n=1 Tax=Arundo donax TaxID=35708 RepID=A0A0A8ZBD7_ARUDO
MLWGITEHSLQIKERRNQ